MVIAILWLSHALADDAHRVACKPATVTRLVSGWVQENNHGSRPNVAEWTQPKEDRHLEKRKHHATERNTLGEEAATHLRHPGRA